MLLNRKERIGFEPEEALVLLEHRNLKDKYNRYLESFINFVEEMEKIKIGKIGQQGVLTKLVKIHNQSKDVKEFIRKLANEFQPKVDKELKNNRKEIKENMLGKEQNPNRPLFSKETTEKIMGHLLTTKEVSEK